MNWQLAVRFLTVLPLPARECGESDLGRSLAYFPAVGLLLGLVAAGVDYLLRLVWPTSVASAGVLITLLLVTGGLHFDGLIDSCDGLFGRQDVQRRLEIMHDSRVGSFGVLGAVAVLLINYATIGALVDPWRLNSLVVMPVLGRWAIVMAIGLFPYARPHGVGRAFKDHLSWREIVVATLTALVVAVGFLGAWGAVALVTVAVLTWLLGKFIGTRIPGLTGDSYGLICVVTETVFLLTILAVVPALASQNW